MISIHYNNIRLCREEYDETKPPGERFVEVESISLASGEVDVFFEVLHEYGSEHMDSHELMADFLDSRGMLFDEDYEAVLDAWYIAYDTVIVEEPEDV